jgi:hypothetical protein
VKWDFVFLNWCSELRTTPSRHFDGQKQTFKKPTIKISSLLPQLGPGMLAAAYSTGGKNEKEEIASLVIACSRPSLTRMRNDSWHGGRYTEHRESREKDCLWRIGRDLNAGVDPLSFLKLPVKSRLKIPAGQRDPGHRRPSDKDQSCGLPTPENSPRLFHAKNVVRLASPRSALPGRDQVVGQYGHVIPLSRSRKQIQKIESASLSHCGFVHRSPAAPQPSCSHG